MATLTKNIAFKVTTGTPRAFNVENPKQRSYFEVAFANI